MDRFRKKEKKKAKKPPTLLIAIKSDIELVLFSGHSCFPFRWNDSLRGDGSQGGAVAYHGGLRGLVLVGGVVALAVDTEAADEDAD